MGNIAYLIPGVKKQIHPVIVPPDTVSINQPRKINAQLQHYEVVAQANRYIGHVKTDIHSGPPRLDIFIPKLPKAQYPVVSYRVPGVKFIDQTPVVVNQDIFEPKSFYPYPISYSTKSLYEYIDQGPKVQASEDVFGFRADPYPYQFVTYPPIQITKYIDQGPQVQSGQHIFGFRANGQYPVNYIPVRSGGIFVDTPAVIAQDVFVRKQNPYPALPYQVPSLYRNIYVPLPPQQTYIFPLPKPIQEWYTRSDAFRYITKVKPFLESVTAITSGNSLLTCVDTSISWINHFASHGWTDIQDQLNAGYPIYVEPALTTGSYQEVFNFGSIIQNIITIVNWNEIAITGTVLTSSTTLETSTDNITWTAPTVGSSVFAQALQYVRLTMNFVGADDKSLAVYHNLQCLLNVHREQDGGQANVFAADAGGTVIALNKAFKALDALTVTPISTVEQKAVYDFAFPPNPTTFKVLLFNSAGVRVNGLVTWVARGIF